MPLTATERETLIVSHLRFAGSYANQFVGRGVAIEDLEGESNLALVQAAQRFDPASHGAKFTTYAGYWIRKRLNAAVDAAKAFPALVAFEADDLVGDDPQPDLDERAKIALFDAIDTLPARDRLILILRYRLGGQRKWTVDEIGQKFRMSAHLVRRSVARSLESVGVHLLSA